MGLPRRALGIALYGSAALSVAVLGWSRIASPDGQLFRRDGMSWTFELDCGGASLTGYSLPTRPDHISVEGTVQWPSDLGERYERHWEALWRPRLGIAPDNVIVDVPLLPVTLVSLGFAACALRRAARRRRRESLGQCASCGYDLTGNVSGRCPECGRTSAAGGRQGAFTE